MANERTKAIGWAYPSSTNAKKLGFANGCWHINMTIWDIEGSGECRTYMPHDAEGFENPDDPDLIALFGEYEGTPDVDFLAYGNAAALAALGLA